MQKNIELTQGAIYSQRVLSELLQKGISRETAYDFVQTLAEKSGNDNLDFRHLVRQSEWMNSLFTGAEIAQMFTLEFYDKHVDSIYKRVFSGGTPR